MIRQRYREEFQSDGVEAVRGKVELGGYEDQNKREAAIGWLAERDIPRKTYRAVKKQLALARRTARETRVALVFLAIILIVSVIALIKAWT
jgi:hypothetical protein